MGVLHPVRGDIMATFNVTTASQLYSALGSAVGGDRIVLAPGNYGNINIYNRNYASGVTLQTGSWTNRAHFDGLNISKSSNLTISGIDLGRGLLPGEEGRLTHLTTVKDSANIKFNAVQFHGLVDNDPTYDGQGLTATRVTGLRIEHSTFTDLLRGVNLQQSKDVILLSNTFDTIRSDGVTVASTNGLLIDRNSFTDIRPAFQDHADAIQFWNTGQTYGSSNVTIRNNVIAPGGDDYAVQGIFISDPGTYGYQNFKIINNLIYSHGAYHGITVTGATGLQVANNTLLSQTTDTKKMWIQLNNSSGVSLTGNVADLVTLNNVTKLTQSNNRDLARDPSFRDVIGDVNDPDTLMDLIVPGVGFQAPLASAALNALNVDAGAYLGTSRVQSALEWQVNSFVALP